jgi:nucleotide-binding universal stress UspA family protein
MLIVGYDDSPGAKRALEFAIELAGELDEGIVLAFAAQPPGRQVGNEYQAHLAALQEHGEEIMGPAVARVREAGVEVHQHVGSLRPVDLLIELAEGHRARMIIVGTQGESPLRGAVLGSTPHKLLHLSRVPVLAVPHS